MSAEGNGGTPQVPLSAHPFAEGGGPIMRVVVDFQPQTGRALVMGPVDEHPELTIMALTEGIKAVASKVLRERSGDIVQVRPKIIRPLVLAALLLAGSAAACVDGTPFEPEWCAMAVNENGAVTNPLEYPLSYCPSNTVAGQPPARVVRGGRKP